MAESGVGNIFKDSTTKWDLHKYYVGPVVVENNTRSGGERSWHMVWVLLLELPDQV